MAETRSFSIGPINSLSANPTTMTSPLFKLGLLLSLFLHSQGGVTEDSTGSLSSCRVRTEDELLKPTTTGAATNQTLQEVCTESSFDDDDDEDVISESSYQVGSPASHVPDELGSDMGEAQSIDMNQAPAILDRITKARSYMEHQVAVDKKYDKVRSLCKNQHPSCAFWAVIGECESNPGYMQVGCAPVCQTCEMLHVETRCPLDPDAVDALYPGDLDKLFENIATSSDFEHFGPKVLSRPSYSPGDNADTADYQLGPWMVTFDNAITDQQADRLIELGGIEGYERSADVGSKKEDGTYTAETNSGRTSTNAWCTNECNEDPVAIEVMDRIATITGECFRR
jgi:prolyl 4-hydroxylase